MLGTVPAMHNDLSWLLHCASTLLTGEELYRDAFEVNPPMSVWLHVPASALQQLTSIPAEWLFKGITLIAIIFSARWYLHLVTETRHHYGLILLAALTLVTPLYSVFGQREHWVVIALLPFLFRHMPDASSPSRNAHRLMDFLAGFAVCVKPHYAVLVAGVLAFDYYKTQRIPATTALRIGAVTFMYGTAIIFFEPDYLTHTLPIAAQTYYYHWLDVKSLFALGLFFYFALIGSMYWFRHTLSGRHRAQALYLLYCAGLACTASLLQLRVWPYTFYPATALLFMAWAWAGMAYSWHVRRFSFLASIGLIAIFAAPIELVDAPYRASPYKDFSGRSIYRQLHTSVHPTGNPTSIAALSPFVYPFFPFVSYHPEVRWEIRFNHMWMIPGTYIHHLSTAEADLVAQLPAPSKEWIETFTLNAVLEDLSNRRPETLFIDISPRNTYPYGYFDYLRWLQKNPKLHAYFQQHYTYHHDMNDCIPSTVETGCHFAVYKRTANE